MGFRVVAISNGECPYKRKDRDLRHRDIQGRRPYEDRQRLE